MLKKPIGWFHATSYSLSSAFYRTLLEDSPEKEINYFPISDLKKKYNLTHNQIKKLAKRQAIYCCKFKNKYFYTLNPNISEEELIDFI